MPWCACSLTLLLARAERRRSVALLVRW